MSTILCPAPNRETQWPATTPTEILIRLIDIHSATAHQTSAPARTTAPRVEKVRRPTVSAAGTSETWAYFEQRWFDYKQATHLEDSDAVFQLLECCDEALRKDLTRTFGVLASSDEQTVLANIKTLAVRQENVMVARVQPQQMRQNRDEPVRDYAARLRGQAGVCNFKIKCSSATCATKVDYSDMIRGALIRGIEDEEIRLDILGESRQDMSLEEALHYIETKESGKRSASRLVNNPPAIAAATSSYRRQEKNRYQAKTSKPSPASLCNYCGKQGHRQGKQERAKKCPVNPTVQLVRFVSRLLKTFGDRCLDDLPNPRLRNLKEKALRYRFRVVHIPGIRHAAADAMSRKPVSEPCMLTLPDDVAALLPSTIPSIEPCLPQTFLQTICADFQDDSTQVCSQTDSTPTELVKSVTWDNVRLATASDPIMIALSKTIEDGFPDDRTHLPPEIREFYQFRENLSTFDGVILYHDRVVVPPSLRVKILQMLHSAHQCVSQMLSRAETSFFWPGMTPAITETRARCSSCNRMAPSQPSAPPTPPVSPAFPFQCIVADYFHYRGHNYLVVVDRYSNWPIVEEASNGAAGLIAALRRIFVTYGISDEFSTDGGPEFTSLATVLTSKSGNPNSIFLSRRPGLMRAGSSINVRDSSESKTIGTTTMCSTRAAIPGSTDNPIDPYTVMETVHRSGDDPNTSNTCRETTH
ncbi:hypothetical protein EGW08_013375 [Elysia chlorotica]|uniref:Integrase zinc-binding domain-containing protein n=1 Tax=Elysia chlorotica TaxID=188477 RepID=A0A433TBJ2_ELYCH|nr:hypothetical protein EGW08_013375 [Elysia chlorotica]